MGKKKKSVSQVVIVHSDTSGDDPKPDTILEETEKTTTTEISMPSDIAPPTPTEDTTSPIQTAEKEPEEAPILSKTDDVVAEPASENDKKEQEYELKTVETTPSENSVELKEIQVNPEDEPNKKTKTNCSKGWCMIL